MTISSLISQVQVRVSAPRELILRRAREAWPNSVDFKDVQVRLMVDALTREVQSGRTMNRVM